MAFRWLSEGGPYFNLKFESAGFQKEYFEMPEKRAVSRNGTKSKAKAPPAAHQSSQFLFLKPIQQQQQERQQAIVPTGPAPETTGRTEVLLHTLSC